MNVNIWKEGGRKRCPPGYHKNKNGQCADKDGNIYQPKQKQPEQGPQSNQTEQPKQQYKQTQQYMDAKKTAEKVRQTQKNVQSIQGWFKRNIEPLSHTTSRNGTTLAFYGLAIVPIVSLVSSLFGLTNKYCNYINQKAQKNLAITKLDIGYAQGLENVAKLMDFKEGQKLTEKELAHFKTSIISRIDELMKSDAIVRRDANSMEYGELKCYFKILVDSDAEMKASYEKAKKMRIELEQSDAFNEIKRSYKLSSQKPSGKVIHGKSSKNNEKPVQNDMAMDI